MRLRFSLRWLVILVALAALLAFGVQMRRVYRDRSAKAERFDAERRSLMVMIARMERSAATIRIWAACRPASARCCRWVACRRL